MEQPADKPVPDKPVPDERGTIRYPAREQEWTPAAESDPEAIEAIGQHIERYFGPAAYVWHEIASDLVHLDVHMVQPTPGRPYLTLVTSGMSDLPMTVPGDAGVSPYAELMMSLPADWPLTEEAIRDEDAYWPIRLLKTVARLPHEYGTWIGPWHSVPNGDPAAPYAPGTPFAGTLIAPMVNCEPEARTITTPSGKEISLLALVPLHPAELELKLAQGSDALIGALDSGGVTERLDPGRPSTV
jgi:hypothetical protein